MAHAATPAFPSFFAEAPVLLLRDPLADFLGAAEDGLMTYAYADAVRFAGHSCPTVAGAFLATRAALQALFPGEVPERGAVKVELREPVEEGVTGVTGSVAAFLTGAAGSGGFKGIGGRFRRAGLLAYGVEMATQLRFTRVDTGAAVGVSVDLRGLPGDPRVQQLMPLCVSGRASSAEQEALRQGWQERVRKLLLDHADDAAMIVVQAVQEPPYG
jgi:formylmethanofuran dehydrogenase subunit E